jgi:hypothetical protein
MLLGLATVAYAAAPAHPGTINYLEGQLSIDDRTLTSDSIGSKDLQPGSTLKTGSGKAEVLLTPGVFLRVGNNSEIRLTAAGLTDTRVEVDRGTVLLEATEVHDENHIQISHASLISNIEKEGLYRFDADRASVAVFDGKAEVRQGDQKVELKKGKQVVAGNSPLRVEKFDRDAAKESDQLYQWSSLRSKYLAEASAATAQRIIVEPRGWYGPGWYWDPWWRTYSWLPGAAFYSPFGYRFYSPWAWSYYGGPRYYGHGWNHGYRGRPYPRVGPRGGIRGWQPGPGSRGGPGVHRRGR